MSCTPIESINDRSEAGRQKTHLETQNFQAALDYINENPDAEIFLGSVEPEVSEKTPLTGFVSENEFRELALKNEISNHEDSDKLNTAYQLLKSLKP